jgi:hypothetical protein
MEKEREKSLELLSVPVRFSLFLLRLSYTN